MITSSHSIVRLSPYCTPSSCILFRAAQGYPPAARALTPLWMLLRTPGTSTSLPFLSKAAAHFSADSRFFSCRGCKKTATSVPVTCYITIYLLFVVYARKCRWIYGIAASYVHQFRMLLKSNSFSTVTEMSYPRPELADCFYLHIRSQWVARVQILRYTSSFENAIEEAHTSGEATCCHRNTGKPL